MKVIKYSISGKRKLVVLIDAKLIPESVFNTNTYRAKNFYKISNKPDKIVDPESINLIKKQGYLIYEEKTHETF